MTNDQFAALATLMPLHDTPSREAARLVLVDGVRPADAARATGISPAAVSNVVSKCRARLALAQAAVGVSG